MSVKIDELISKINGRGIARNVQITRAAGDEKDSEQYEISISSEKPVERWFGMEILGHSKGEIVTDFIGSGNAPLLLYHDRSQQIGVVQKMWVDDGRAKAIVRFGKSALAREIKDDVDDGIRRNVSIGYSIYEMRLEKEEKGKPDVYRITRWKPFEVSIVAVPGDETVGTNRAKDTTEPTTHKGNIVPEETKQEAVKTVEVVRNDPQELERAKAAATTAERSRMTQISEIGAQHNVSELAQRAISEGKSVEDFRKSVLEEIRKKSESAQQMPEKKLSTQEKRDLKNYSLVRAIQGVVRSPFGGTGGLSGLEAEMHQEAEREAKDYGLTYGNGLLVPSIIVHGNRGQRDLTVGTEGADLVQASVSGELAGLFRARLMLEGMGARVLRGLTGNVIYPKITAGSSVISRTEVQAATETTPTTGNMTLSPTRYGDLIEVSKQTLLQSSPDVEYALRADMEAAYYGTVEAAAITALLAASGIGNVAGGTNGLAPTWAHIIELESDVSIANADVGKLYYLTNAAVRGKLKQTAKVSSTDSVMVWGNKNELNGYEAMVTNHVPSDLDKGASTGICSAIIFGYFPELFIGMWGGLELVVDPVTKAEQALTRLIVNGWADADVRRPAAFSAMQDALTA